MDRGYSHGAPPAPAICSAPAVEVRIAGDVKRSGPLLDEVCEGRVDLAFAAGSKHDELQPSAPRRHLRLVQLQLGIRIVRVHEHGDDGGIGNELVQQLQSLRREQIGEEGDARDIAARPVEAGDKSVLDRVAAETEDDRYRCGRGLGRERRDGVLAAITATRRRTRSAANAGSRSYCPSAERNSIATFRPSTKPASLRPWRKRAMFCVGPAADVPSRYPITGIAGCCARAASGHAAAAPPRSVMNSRRFIRSPRRRAAIASRWGR